MVNRNKSYHTDANVKPWGQVPGVTRSQTLQLRYEHLFCTKDRVKTVSSGRNAILRKPKCLQIIWLQTDENDKMDLTEVEIKSGVHKAIFQRRKIKKKIPQIFQKPIRSIKLWVESLAMLSGSTPSWPDRSVSGSGVLTTSFT